MPSSEIRFPMGHRAPDGGSRSVARRPVGAGDGALPGCGLARRTWIAALFVAATTQAAPVLPDFAADVLPILSRHCHSCHGPKEAKGGLRLDRQADALRGGDTGPALQPGAAARSLIFQYVSGTSTNGTVMPPRGERLTSGELIVLRAWIDAGAAWPAVADPGDAGTATPDHWAFRPVQRPLPPGTEGDPAAHNPIDAFVLSGLARARLSPAGEADRRTLLRRLYQDLLGMLPEPAEVDRFVSDTSPDAYERRVDEVLASPHFGERWARHWLDLAHYADSDGYEDDKFRPDAWRYRDWVVRALNGDMPYDRFTVAQLAGDLVPGADDESRTATGFLRTTLSNNAGAGGIAEEYRVKAVKDRLNTTGTIWLGLTVSCAECHSHKYDPISLREYYQLYAFFNGTDEASIPAPGLSERYQREHAEALRQFEERLQSVRQALDNYERLLQPERQRAWETAPGNRAALPTRVREILESRNRPRREEDERQLRDYFRSIDPEHARLKARIPVGDEIGNNRPLPPSSRALVIAESPVVRVSHIQRRGDFLRPGAAVDPATPEFLPPLQAAGPRPSRLDLARWLVSPGHPLTARVAVNRLWQHLFGQGLVPSSDNFGTKGEAPVHRELLDWLAAELVESRWSQKAVLRIILRSATYRQSSRVRPEVVSADPNNVWLARQVRLRLEAESVRDTALSASGLLQREVGGPSFQPPLPVSLSGAKELKNERFMEVSPAVHRHRRGLYVNVQRTFPNPMLKTFDAADANVCTVKRDRSNTALQALTLLNDPVWFEAATALARRATDAIQADPGADPIRLIVRWALGRDPDSLEYEELRRVSGVPFPAAADGREAGETEDSRTPNASPTDTRWIAVARVVLNLDEFITRE